MGMTLTHVARASSTSMRSRGKFALHHGTMPAWTNNGSQRKAKDMGTGRCISSGRICKWGYGGSSRLGFKPGTAAILSLGYAVWKGVEEPWRRDDVAAMRFSLTSSLSLSHSLGSAGSTSEVRDMLSVVRIFAMWFERDQWEGRSKQAAM